MSANKLRLGPLPKTETLKLTFAWSANLKVELDRYAALHTQIYGEAVDAVALIPHMLEAFMERDRGSKRLHRARSVAAPADSSDHLRRSTPT